MANNNKTLRLFTDIQLLEEAEVLADSIGSSSLEFSVGNDIYKCKVGSRARLEVYLVERRAVSGNKSIIGRGLFATPVFTAHFEKTTDGWVLECASSSDMGEQFEAACYI